MADGPSQGSERAFFPPAVLELGGDGVYEVIGGEAFGVEHRLDEGVVSAAADAFDYREVLFAREAGGTDQDEAGYLLGVTGGVGEDNLAAEARSYEVVWWVLDILVQVVGEPFDEVIYGDFSTGGEVIVENVAVVDE